MSVALPFSPTYSSPLTTKTRMKIAPFGDGYKQRILDGVNPITDSWALKFKLTDEDWATFRTFLRTNLGQTVDWTAPGELTAQKWAYLEGWNCNPIAANHWELSLTIEEVFI